MTSSQPSTDPLGALISRVSEDEAKSVERHHRNARLSKAELEEWAAKSPAERYDYMFVRGMGRKGFDPEAFAQRWGTSDAPAEALVTFDAPAFIKSTRTKATKEAPTMNETRYLGLGIGRKSFGAQIAAKMAGRDGSDMFEGGSHYGTKALTSSGQVV